MVLEKNGVIEIGSVSCQPNVYMSWDLAVNNKDAARPHENMDIFVIGMICLGMVTPLLFLQPSIYKQMHHLVKQ